jgi:tetratricopeptide (TPR) repeat protein
VQDQLDEQIVKDLYSTFIKTHTNDLSIKNAYGRWLHSRGYLVEAENILKALVDSSPGFLPAKYNYGRLLLDTSRCGEAIDQFKQALLIFKKHQMTHDGLAQAFRGLAALAEQEGRLPNAERYFAEAEREFRQAIYWADVQGQSIAILCTHLGSFYIERKRWEDALKAFEQAISENPDFFGNYWGKGQALMGLGQFQNAADILRTALEKAPEDFQPPASEEIPELLKQCQAAIGDTGRVSIEP